jgi:hypothetical protein
MTAPSDSQPPRGNEPLPPGDGAPVKPPQTASGLDEEQIHPEDIAALQALFTPHSVIPGVQVGLFRHTASIMQPGLSAASCHRASLELASPRSLPLRFAALPAKVRTRQHAWHAPKLKLRKDVKAALAWPVLRRRQDVEDLPQPVQKALFEAVFRRYGGEARAMQVRAVFAHIPPEAGPSIRLGPELEAATFQWPANIAVAKAKPGHYLVVLELPDGKTRNVIFRLE